MISVVVKQPGETLQRKPMFATSAAIVELVDIGVVPRGLVPGAAALTFARAQAGGVITVELIGGGDGERYLVTIRARDADDQVLEDEIEVAVVEGTWALPDGGTPHLTIAEFVARFGLEEVVRMTDADGSGRIDRPLLIAALTDAQALADANLSGRYALPLATVPAILKMVEADIARSRLYPRGAPEGVADAAKAAVRTLERIQAGQMQLGLPSAETPATDTATPILIAPGRRAYPDLLTDF